MKFIVVTTCLIALVGCKYDFINHYDEEKTGAMETPIFIVGSFPSYSPNLSVMLKSKANEKTLVEAMKGICMEYKWFDPELHNVYMYIPPKSGYEPFKNNELIAIYSATSQKIERYGVFLSNDISLRKGWCVKN
ncbi:MAG: hypothetical protein RL180_735 [Pseudomonadota bacterium]|jgi:hypothetical protein